MKVSSNWLKNYVDLEGISPQKIISKLTMSGLEVEDFIIQSEVYKDFVVGYVIEKIKHPNADKLSLCKVTDGKDEFHVVCGAPNVDAGQKVVFAKVGAVIPQNGLVLSKVKIRGVESEGMICSEAELNLSDDHEGIMVLPSRAKTGAPIIKALQLNDVVMDIAVTPNRSDALSHAGAARDLAALFNRKLKLPKIKLKKSKYKVKDFARIEIVDSINCPRYSAKVVKGVQIKESPDWLKVKLRNIGLRPINNVVDVTNFVMYELGQPLHAFDLKRLAGQKIIVKKAGAQKDFITLDSKLRKLEPETVMICDAEKPVAIGGVMGGENSEITEATEDILIESAYFNPKSIRRTSKYLGLSTDSSYRFERGCDPSNTAYAAERAAQLIAELCSAEEAEGIIDVYPVHVKERQVSVRFDRVNHVLGYKISAHAVVQILKNLGLKLINRNQSNARFKVPTFRTDLEREIDLIEEIARVHGYDKIPAVTKISINLEKKIDESEFNDQLRAAANALGFYEAINNSLQSEKLASMLGKPIAVLNPQNIDMAYLRTSLVPGILTVIANNINVGEKDLMLFEIGKVFNLKDGSINSFNDFSEDETIIFALTGKKERKEWYNSEQIVDFYDLKGLVESFLNIFSLDNVLNDSYYSSANQIFDYYFVKKSSEIVVGKGGKVKKEVLKNFDIEQNVFLFEFSVEELKKIRQTGKKFVEPLRFPKVVRDFAFIFDKDVSHNEVVDFIRSEAGALLKEVKLFDLFESESLGHNNKSLAFTLEFFDEQRTLKEEEVEKEFFRIIKSIEKKFNAELRG